MRNLPNPRTRWLWPGIAVLAVIGFTVVSQAIFARFEGRDLSFHHALLFVAETISTTGYGELLPFRSPVTTAWSLFLMAAGLVTIFVWFATLAGGWLAARFQALPPRQAPRRLRDHVVVCGGGAVGRFLARDLQRDGVPHLLVDSQRGTVTEMMREGLAVMEGDVRQPGTLQAAGIGSARALIATLPDADNASVCLLARAMRADLPLYCTVEHSDNERFLHAAGATAVFSAKRTLGERLGWLATAPLAGQLDRLRGQVAELAVCQVPVLPGSTLAAPTLGQARVRERTGATVLGLWSYGHFVPAHGPDTPLRAGQVLIAAGRPDDLERLQALAHGRVRPLAPPAPGALILGYGDVGAAAAAALGQAGVPYRVLSLDAPAGTPGWIAGDATDGDSLEQAGIAAVGRCVVALDNDARAVFATLLARQLSPGLRIVARANTVEAVARLYLAGADNVLSLSEVAGTQLARQVHLPGTGPPALDELGAAEAPVPAGLAGRSLAGARVGTRTGCIVLGVRAAGGGIEVNPSPQRTLHRDESLILFGTAGQLQQFRAAFDG